MTQRNPWEEPLASFLNGRLPMPGLRFFLLSLALGVWRLGSHGTLRLLLNGPSIPFELEVPASSIRIHDLVSPGKIPVYRGNIHSLLSIRDNTLN